MTKESKYVTKAQLKSKYQFTEIWIKRLGDPDETISGVAHLWLVERVERYINQHVEEFCEIYAALQLDTQLRGISDYNLYNAFPSFCRERLEELTSRTL